MKLGPDDKAIITLADCRDTYNFTCGQPLELVEVASPRSWLGRFARDIWRSLTAPFRKRCIVVAVNVDCGTITVADDPKWYRFL